jgi:hypothetical protein
MSLSSPITAPVCLSADESWRVGAMFGRACNCVFVTVEQSMSNRSTKKVLLASLILFGLSYYYLKWVPNHSYTVTVLIFVKESNFCFVVT